MKQETQLPERSDRQYRQAHEEDELAEDAAVPADDGKLDADPRTGVPVHERRERQDEPRDPGDPLAGAPQPSGRDGADIVGCARARRLDLEEVRGFHAAIMGITPVGS